MHNFLQFLKKILGPELTRKIRPIGHGIKSYLAAVYYKFPGKKLKIIGITGTKGKTTSTIYLGRLLNLFGIKTGYLSTALLFDGQEEVLNPFKNTTIDGVAMQKLLQKMVANGCQYAVLEMSSQGLEQGRHKGLGKLDGAIITNIHPEHIEAHGSYDNYIKAKSILFTILKSKAFGLINGDPEQAEPMQKLLNFAGSKFQKKEISSKMFESHVTEDLFLDYTYNGSTYKTKAIAKFNLFNLTFCLEACRELMDNFEDNLDQVLADFVYQVPGRMEFIIKDGKTIFK